MLQRCCSGSANSGHVVYLLTNQTTKQYTYVGKTNNLPRRLRQHNGEVQGGAKATKLRLARCRQRHPHDVWIVAAVVQPFCCARAALRFEYAVKHWKQLKSMRRGLAKRLRALHTLLKLPSGGRWNPEARLTVFVSNVGGRSGSSQPADNGQ